MKLLTTDDGQKHFDWFMDCMKNYIESPVASRYRSASKKGPVDSSDLERIIREEIVRYLEEKR